LMFMCTNQLLIKVKGPIIYNKELQLTK
jgi:hypothetical protein